MDFYGSVKFVGYGVSYLKNATFERLTSTQISALTGSELYVGRIAYDTTLGQYRSYNGTQWITMITALKLRPVKYQLKNEKFDGITLAGFIVEEVHEAGLTEFVVYDAEGEPDAVSCASMVSLCMGAIKEQNTKM